MEAGGKVKKGAGGGEGAVDRRRSPCRGPLRPVYSSPWAVSADSSKRADTHSVSERAPPFTSPRSSNTSQRRGDVKIVEGEFRRWVSRAREYAGWRGKELSSLGSIAARSIFVRSVCNKLFVGGLSYDTNEAALKDAFSQHGDIIEVRVICHPTTGKSKGFGFVEFSSESVATAALQKMDGQLLDGRKIRVHYANKG
uniref:RRM domain-containing protein n=1 Tax=Ananas comosus var. bracteatus TaxID=296719 RepID=A0A6V7PD95_ANACO|nr:unnamed protein product [Ananas comosus var. bracteatus]